MTDDDSDDDDEEDDDCVPAHDPAMEIKPRLPIYHPAFKIVGDMVKQLLTSLEEYIINSGYTDEAAKHILSEIKAHFRISYGDNVRVGFIGNAGVGKSSLINSLLGVPNLALEADEGDSCTYVVTEFVQASPMQKKPFAAEVELFCRDVCLKMVTGFFTQWAENTHKLEARPEEYGEADNDAARAARECLHQLFADKKEFRDLEAAEAFLSTARSSKDIKVLARLRKWTSDLLAYLSPDTLNSLNFETGTAKELLEQILPFMRTYDNASFQGKPLRFSPWPFGPSPGTCDINNFRVENANRYLQACDLTVVVAHIDRAEKNAVFKRQYCEAYRRRRSESVVLVLTRSDAKGKRTFQMSAPDEERLDKIERLIICLKSQSDIKSLNIERKKAAGEKKGNKKLRKQKEKILKRIRALEAEKMELKIVVRNRRVANHLSQNYRLDTKDGARVPIFCVSNKDYMSYIRGGQSVDPPKMQLLETQVPQIRAHIYSQPSNGKFATLDHYYHLVQIVDQAKKVWCPRHYPGSCYNILTWSQDVEIAMKGRINSFHGADVTELVDELSSDAQHSIQWTFRRCAAPLCNKYARYTSAGHRAFVRNNGNWKTGKIPPANWNEELLGSVEENVDRIFAKLLDEGCENFKAELSEAIKEVVNGLNSKLRNDPQALVCNTYKTCFLDNIGRYENEIGSLVDVFIKDLLKDLRIVHAKTVTDGEGHYFSEAMLEVYTKCNVSRSPIRGKTLHKCRCEIFENMVCGPNGPFRSVPDRVDAAICKAVNQNGRKLNNGILNIFGTMKKDFARMAQKKDNDSPEGKKFRAELYSLVDEAKLVLNGPVKECLELCRHFK
ncbi:hypothetical protein BCR34DRAFT_624118 [Clohesyomyces aquaticus]|uniref:DUF7605 domain-containing protein n=1 Tax=Clohesyomyces aquaticus TaxID=1231657 RepID=A0A1Y1ZSP5_9PLEO|nr:hypothetical protein BCR34DRAFT_624118 [Clohesyomyces aquaticus]